MPFGPFFADFAASDLKLIIEIDGASHESKEEYDRSRDRFMMEEGWTVLRYTEEQVNSALDDVLADIHNKLTHHLPPEDPSS
jgi:very-short-patch-repair endonuclease